MKDCKTYVRLKIIWKALRKLLVGLSTSRVFKHEQCMVIPSMFNAVYTMVVTEHSVKMKFCEEFRKIPEGLYLSGKDSS